MIVSGIGAYRIADFRVVAVFGTSTFTQCHAEISAIEAQIRAGHTDLEGLCLALADWSAELRLLQANGRLATHRARLAPVRSCSGGLHREEPRRSGMLGPREAPAARDPQRWERIAKACHPGGERQ